MGRRGGGRKGRVRYTILLSFCTRKKRNGESSREQRERQSATWTGEVYRFLLQLVPHPPLRHYLRLGCVLDDSLREVCDLNSARLNDLGLGELEREGGDFSVYGRGGGGVEGRGVRNKNKTMKGTRKRVRPD